MKKVWNVYKRSDGFRIASEPYSRDDNYCRMSDVYTFLGQVTEEIEEPKKEVERVIRAFKSKFDTYSTIETIPDDAYDITVHYKIKE